MEKRYIGIDIDGRHLRVAVISQDREALIAVGRREYAAADEIPGILREMIGETRVFGDRLAAALPAVEGFVRQLVFPFGDLRKIESALRFELAAQVPVPIEQLSTDFQAPQVDSQGSHRVTAVAVRTAAVESFLQTFDAADIPLHILDLAPFAIARGLKDRLSEGVLVHLAEREITIGRLRDGRLHDYRLLPAAAGDAPATARLLLRESAPVQREAAGRDLPFFLVGPGATPELLDALRQDGRQAEIPGIFVEGEAVEAEFLPAVALAERAAIQHREREINFRRGRFALKNEWTALRRELAGAAAILLLTLAAVAGAAWLNYSHRARQVQTLEKEIASVFQATFPGAPRRGDPLQQMQASIRQLQERGRLIGAGRELTPLAALQEISRAVPPTVSLDVREFNYTPEALRLEGTTTSFDAINQIARSLEQSPLFAEAQIADAKMSADGSRVDFRLTLVYRGAKEQP